MFALGAQARELLLLGQVLEGQMARVVWALGFQLAQARLPGGESFVEARFVLLPGFQFGRFGGGGAGA